MTSKAPNQNKSLAPLKVLVGEWKTVGKHPMLPDVTLNGKVVFKWIENGAFLQMNSTINHEKFPEGIALFGSDDSSEEFKMIYYDERGVSRIYSCTLKDNVWSWWRNDAQFSQKFDCEIRDDGNTIIGKGKMSQNGGEWEDDLQLNYTRLNSNCDELSGFHNETNFFFLVNAPCIDGIWTKQAPIG